MNHQIVLDNFFSGRQELQVQKKILEDHHYEVPITSIKDFMISITEISLTEMFNYMDNHPCYDKIASGDISQCGALEACTQEVCSVLLDSFQTGKTSVEIGQHPIFEKYLRSQQPSSWFRFGSCQAKTAQQLGLAFKDARRWYLSGYGYVYAYRSLSERQQTKFLCRVLFRNPFYARVLSAVRTEKVHLSQYMQLLAPSTQGRRSSSVMKLLQICLDEMDREGIKWCDIYVPKYRAKTGTVVEQVISGTKGIFDTYTVREDFFKGGIPLYSVKAACGYFDSQEVPEQEGWIDVSPSGIRASQQDYFVVYAKGDSMLPKIKDGDLCLFRWYHGEPIDGSIVLTQCRDYDEEYESSYTIKRFRQCEAQNGKPQSISLDPLNTSRYSSIVLSAEDGYGHDYKTVGVFVKVLEA